MREEFQNLLNDVVLVEIVIFNDVWNQTESVSGNEEPNDQENLPFPSRNNLISKPNRTEGKALRNNEGGESGSITENLLQKPIICSCCRKRNEKCNSGDTLDTVPSKEYNGVTQKNEFPKSEQVERYETYFTLPCIR